MLKTMVTALKMYSRKLKLIAWNVRDLALRKGNLIHMIKQKKLDIVLMQETKLGGTKFEVKRR